MVAAARNRMLSSSNMKPTPRPAFLKVATSFTCKGTLFAFPLALSTGGTMTPSQPQFSSPNDIRDMQENAEDTLQSAKQQLNEMLDGITERAREYGRYADEQVQQNPWTAVGVGFGVGIVMGALLMLAGRR
jgi:ElaB/YqjD/DUF883 family membrane-anchored ribosome-binding protein